jgi:hypothetical protein
MWSVSQVAIHLGVSRQAASRIVLTQGFPAPAILYGLRRDPGWHPDAVKEWTAASWTRGAERQQSPQTPSGDR